LTGAVTIAAAPPAAPVAGLAVVVPTLLTL
jgi:hypothetical protein